MPRTCQVNTTTLPHIHETSGRLYAVNPQLLRKDSKLKNVPEACKAAFFADKTIPGELKQDAT